MAILSTSSTQSKLDKLSGKKYQSDKNSKQLMFPLDLGNDPENNVGHCVIFEPNIIKGHNVAYKTPTTPTTGTQLSGAYGREVAMQVSGINGGSIRSSTMGGNLYTKSDESIVLPMPTSMAVTYASNWQTIEIGGLARAGDFINSVRAWDGSAVDQFKDSATRSLAGAAQAIGLGNVKDLIEIKTGYMENPYVEVLFKGTNNRIIPFSYVLTPRNLKEAETIRSMITRFKFHAAPEFKYGNGNNSFMLHPSTFDVTFLDLNTGSPNKWQFRMSTLALTNITVNGTPNGEYAVSTSGNPTSVSIDLYFTELTTLNKQNFTDPEASF